MVIILGLGFTGQRLAWRLLRRGESVFAAVRDAGRFPHLAQAGLKMAELKLDGSSEVALPRQAILVNLIPPLSEAENTTLREVIRRLDPKRLIYISSTGVYGEQVDVDSETVVKPSDERGRRRLEEEQWVASGPWTSLSLRAAAIYGPGRGVHVAIREGRVPRGTGAGLVSRIHVEDLAAIVEAGIYSELQGAWPVADDEPCATAEISAWFSRAFGSKESINENITVSTAGRRVDGRRVRKLLGVALTYSSWKTGIPASLEEEGN